MEVITTSLKNHFLIATPALMDPYFYHSVTYICEHDENGALGLVLSHTTNFELGDLLQQMAMPYKNSNIVRRKLRAGGPIEEHSGFILHRPLGQWQTTLPITAQTGLTTSEDILMALAAGNGPQDAIVILGYAGWEAGQLEDELTTNAWLTHPADPDLLFNTPPEQLWHSAANALGVNLNQLSLDAGHA